eukprot:TRINITY_DN23360_c0_g1_i2.p1 TRINITY_DN23360_c0_g1~~TRINITY_DN23360_c0_g1_i2.p1  ORF type:complete len:146 (+),score=2.90 TRINITY_DN23360_c0_g1_i2:170-607(+)
MCIRDRYQRRVRGRTAPNMEREGGAVGEEVEEGAVGELAPMTPQQKATERLNTCLATLAQYIGEGSLWDGRRGGHQHELIIEPDDTTEAKAQHFIDVIKRILNRMDVLDASELLDVFLEPDNQCSPERLFIHKKSKLVERLKRFE